MEISVMSHSHFNFVSDVSATNLLKTNKKIGAIADMQYEYRAIKQM